MLIKTRVSRFAKCTVIYGICFFMIIFLSSTYYDVNKKRSQKTGDKFRFISKNFEKRYANMTHLQGINTMAFQEYFLNFTNLVQFASREDIPVISVSKANCTAMLYMDGKGYKKARQIEHYNISVYNETSKLKALLQNCDIFHKTRTYIKKPINEEEAEFPLAFSIIAYKDAFQIERLLRAIYRPQNIYCIHIDLNSSDETFTIIKRLSDCFPNVLVPTSTRVHVEWGWYSVLEAELVCMRHLLAAHERWRYFINLTGQEFPLKTNLELVRILKMLNGTNNIGMFPFPKHQYFRLKNDYAEYKRNSNYTVSQPFKYRLNWKKGSLHIAATRQFVEFALHNEVAVELQKYLQRKAYPDETFFQTLHGNPQLGTPGAYTDDTTRQQKIFTRYKLWKESTANYKGKTLIPIHVDSYPNHTVALNGYNPPGKTWCYGVIEHKICVIGIGDLRQVWQSPHMFVNKLNATFSPLTYDCLEELIMKKIKNEVEGIYTLNLEQ